MRIRSSIFLWAAIALPGAFVWPDRPATREPVTTDRSGCSNPNLYYAIDLVRTDNIPGLIRAGGKGLLTYSASPFGVSITRNGHYEYDLTIQAEHLPGRADGSYVAWITTPDLERVERIGRLDASLQARGTVTFNKFIVVVTFETATPGEVWKGPIVLRGISRSGLMHTMAGHGPFSREPCAKYGY